MVIAGLASTVWIRKVSWGAGVPRSPHERDGETVAHVKVPGGHPAGVARRDKGSDPEIGLTPNGFVKWWK